ncbi:hypothetical protein [Roseovarius amoyensis]|uniref:hypothetical protein n=1 Tax=Roseovarius amoyensis TaxID=2211448 RepID=UPI000DBE3686|nr:hypothetical protein [Roseovarius amoyensis]
MYVRISTQIDETYDEAGELPVVITYDIEGDECTAEPYSWGGSRGTDLRLDAEVYNVKIGNLNLSRDQAVLLFSDEQRDGEQFLKQLEEYAAERAAARYREGELCAA